MNLIIEEQFTHEGHLCVVTFSKMGHRCGYVAVDEDSPLYEKEYTDDLEKPELLKELEQTEIGKRGIISVFCWDGKKITPKILFNVHGGITYSGGKSHPIKTDPQLWWFGFDCAHLDDKIDIKAIKKHFGPGGVNSLYHSYHITSGTVRTKEYVIQECKSLAEQISCVELTY